MSTPGAGQPGGGKAGTPRPGDARPPHAARPPAFNPDATIDLPRADSSPPTPRGDAVALASGESMRPSGDLVLPPGSQAGTHSAAPPSRPFNPDATIDSSVAPLGSAPGPAQAAPGRARAAFDADATIDSSVRPPPSAPAFNADATVDSSASVRPGAASGGTIADATLATRDGAGADEATRRLNFPKIEGYELTRRLGRGGMGVVYQGVQQATGRQVAVKFMLDEALGSERSRKRFEREVEVVAGLQHPGIVSVLDSGVRKGRYFYVMEYVEGRSLDEALEPGKCDLRTALLLLAEVCEAVDYAHQRAVLHRDLKPSNIIVDGAGKPHLLDFGLAKKVDDPDDAPPAGSHGKMGLTMSEPGQLLGTVAYMSPEQSLGKADEASVRSDVYSLGVIGYELVAGRLPILMEGSLREVLHQIAEKDPPAPSTLRARVARDVDAILLRALEKQPDRRYPTAGAFAADIRAFLAGRAVEARRVGPAGRAWRWVKRNKALSVVTAVAAGVLVTTSTILIVRVVQERDRANAAAEETRAALVESQRNERIAKSNFDILNSVLLATNPETGQREPTMRQFLALATRRLNEPSAAGPLEPATEAQLRDTITTLQLRFGEYGAAEGNARRGVELLESQGDRRALARSLHNLAASLWWQGQYDQARPLYERSLAIRRELYPVANEEVATSLTHLAACILRQGDVLSARALYKEALETRRTLAQGQDAEPVAQALNNLAKTFTDTEEYEEARDLFRQALDMVLRVRGPTSLGAAAASANLAQCLLDMGDATGARELFQSAVDIRRAQYRGGHPLLAAALVGLAQAQLAAGDAETALATARQAVDMYEALRKPEEPEQPDFTDALDGLGRVLVATGRPADAEPLYERAIEIAGRISPPDALKLAVLHARQAHAIAARDPEGARRLLAESVADVRARRGPHSRLAASLELGPAGAATDPGAQHGAPLAPR